MKNIKIIKLYKKLDYKIINPYEIISKKSYLYKLEFPVSFNIKNVFYISLLKLAIKDPLLG